jgi:hypothetical protein
MDELSPEVESFFEGLSPEHRSLVSDIRKAVLAALPDLEEAIKWQRLTFTRSGNWHHWICGIGVSKKSGVTLHFHKGALLDDPHGLLSGDGKYIRTIAGKSFKDIDEEAFRLLLADAAQKQVLMLESS